MTKVSNIMALENILAQDNSCKGADIINFPQKINPIRPAGLSDIKNIVELWANSATLRYFYDPIRWRWKGKASEIWSDYATEIINDTNRFLVICDLKDNGLSGFLIARIEELPGYYEARYSLTIEDFYIRPKDRNISVLKQMMDTLLGEAHESKNILSGRGIISLKIEILDSEDSVATLLEEAGFRKSSSTYTVSVN